MTEAKAFELLGDRAATKIRTAADNNPGGLAAGVGVNDVDPFDGVEQVGGRIFDTWFGSAHEQAIRPSLWDTAAESALLRFRADIGKQNCNQTGRSARRQWRGQE